MCFDSILFTMLKRYMNVDHFNWSLAYYGNLSRSSWSFLEFLPCHKLTGLHFSCILNYLIVIFVVFCWRQYDVISLSFLFFSCCYFILFSSKCQHLNIMPTYLRELSLSVGANLSLRQNIFFLFSLRSRFFFHFFLPLNSLAVSLAKASFNKRIHWVFLCVCDCFSCCCYYLSYIFSLSHIFRLPSHPLNFSKATHVYTLSVGAIFMMIISPHLTFLILFFGWFLCIFLLCFLFYYTFLVWISFSKKFLVLHCRLDLNFLTLQHLFPYLKRDN